MILQQTNKQQEKQLSMTTVNMPMDEYTILFNKAKEYNSLKSHVAKLEADLKEKIDNERKRGALMSSDRHEIRELKKQNEQLEEENEILKQFALDVHNFAFSTNMDDLDIVSAMDLGSVVEELNKDEDKLYKEIEEQKKEIERRDEIIQNHIKELTFQKECRETENKEIAELKKERDSYELYGDLMDEVCDDVYSKFCCGNDLYKITFDYIEERLKRGWSSRLSIFKMIKSMKEELNDAHDENMDLKKENEEQLAAVEALKFMDYTYNDGSWMEKEEEDEEEVNVKGTITLKSDTEPYEEMIIRFNNMITKEQYEDEDFMDNIDDELNLLSGFHTTGYDIQIDFE